MFDRLLVAAGLILIGWLAYRLYVEFQLKGGNSQSLGLPGYQTGVATILYFTTLNCAPCRTVQKPALAKIKDRFDRRVNVLEIDASRQPELADAWGVLSVPTTFIIDSTGQPRGVNHGTTRADKLQSQLEDIGVEPNQNSARPKAHPAHSRES